FTAARRVGPTGSVVATDLSPAMLSLAREEAARVGLRHVEFREMDAEEPDLPVHSFDAALCRWTLMFLPHLVAALTRLRELLVPEGRFAAAVWGPPERVPLPSIPMGVIRHVLKIPHCPRAAQEHSVLLTPMCWSARSRRRVSLRWRSNAIRSPSNTPRSRISSKNAPSPRRASASRCPRPLPPSANRSGRWSPRGVVSIRTQRLSCEFLLKPAVLKASEIGRAHV